MYTTTSWCFVFSEQRRSKLLKHYQGVVRPSPPDYSPPSCLDSLVYTFPRFTLCVCVCRGGGGGYIHTILCTNIGSQIHTNSVFILEPTITGIMAICSTIKVFNIEQRTRHIERGILVVHSTTMAIVTFI